MLGLKLALRIGRDIIDVIGKLLSKLAFRSTYSENLAASRSIISKFTDYNILEKASILLTPTAYSDARVHSVKTYTGDELVTNGDFSDGTNDWTNNASATLSIENDKLKVSISGAGSGYGQQNIIGLTIGATYKISAEGEIGTSTRLALYTPNAGFNNLYADGTISTFFTATSTTENLRLYVYDDGAYGFWDNVSVIDVSSDFDFDRASSATRINSSGLVQDMQSITDVELVQNGDFSELGSELVVNGNFNDGLNGWNNNATFPVDNLSVVNNKLELENISGSTQVFTSDSFNVTSGETYKISLDTIKESGVDDFDITLRTTALGTVVETITTTQQTGSLTYYFTSSSTQSVIFQFTLRDTIKGSVDNVSVKQVDPNDRWSLGTGWSIEDGKLVGDGTNTSFSSAQQDNTTVSGNTYQVTLTVEAANGAIELKGAGVYTRIDTLGVGTHTLTFVADATYFRFLAHAGATATIDNISVKDITFSTDLDLARINYDSNGDNGHILLEPTSTNLITYSEDFSQSVWTKNDVLIEGGYTAPDGSNTAYKVTNNGSNAHLVGFNNQNTSRHKSIWAKTVSGIGSAYLLNQTGNNLFTLTNEWQRFDATHSGADFFYAVDLRGSQLTEVILWGAQLEALSYATSYIPTLTGSTVTRATETLTGSGNSTLINSTEGVLYAEIAALANDGTSRAICISDGTNTHRALILYNATTNQIQAFHNDGSSPLSLFHTVSNVDDFHKVAFKYKLNDFALWIDGVEVDTSSSGGTNTANTLNQLAFENATGSSDFYGKCKALAVFDRALTDQELTDLTS